MDLFHIIFCITYSFCAFVRVYYQHKSKKYKVLLGGPEAGSNAGKSGIFFSFGVLEITFLIGVSIIVVYCIRPGLYEAGKMYLPDSLRWLGVGIMVFSALFHFWIHHILGNGFHGGIAIHPDARLAISGPYKIVRHPMYVNNTIMSIGMVLITSNFILLLSSLFFYIIPAFSRVRNEEKILLDTFGEDYEKYQSRTGKLFPKWQFSKG